ncbi:unnamed protein product [Heterosigma akashiwo]
MATLLTAIVAGTLFGAAVLRHTTASTDINGRFSMFAVDENEKTQTPLDRVRKPAEYTLYEADLFSHPVVKDAFSTQSATVQGICGGPTGNIKTWVDESEVNKDLVGSEGYTVFSMDCRDSSSNPLISFVVVLDTIGNIAAVHHPDYSAMSVSMFAPDVVMFALRGGKGVHLWNWRENSVQELPFNADPTTLQYRYSDNKFYGLYPTSDKGTSIVSAFDPETGTYPWAFESMAGKVNQISLAGEYAYLSMSTSTLQKVDMRTNELVWTLGGRYSDFHLYDKDANFLDANNKVKNHNLEDETDPEGHIYGTFQHQTGAQHLSDRYYSLFDNNVCSNNDFCNAGRSRLVVMNLQEDLNLATEVFSFDTGDQCRSVGSAAVLPSGNVLGNSDNAVVFPASAEYKYHANLWEVNPATNRLAWRVGVEGLNPAAPGDRETPYTHTAGEGAEPQGWTVYNAERFYAKPVLSRPCVAPREAGGLEVRVLPHNSIRTQEDMDGTAYLYDKATKTKLAEAAFQFQKSWLAEPVGVAVPEEFANSADLALLVSNSWGQGALLDLGPVEEVASCAAFELSNTRLFV